MAAERIAGRASFVRLSVQWKIYLIGYGAVSIVLVGFGLVVHTEWAIAAGLRSPDVAQPNLMLAIVGPLIFAIIDVTMAGLMIANIIRVVAGPMDRLLSTSRQIAEGGRPDIPFAGRTDEVGTLARAMEGWRDASEARELLLARAPVGICQMDRAGIVRDANLAAAAMVGCAPEDLVGRRLLTLVHGDDAPTALANVRAILEGSVDHADFEARVVRADRMTIWCSVAVAPIGSADGRPTSAILILADISDRKRQAAKAASVQRELVPHAAPPLDGYDLAGICLPAADVAGDLYDWALTDDGCLDLTLADVMGKGMRAALVMARLQTALATAPRDLGPAARVSGADRSVTFNMDAGELFVTLFQARLELATGVLRYVDAGHGYCMVVRDGGEVVPLAGTSMPLGLNLGEVYHEETVTLGPGDTLVVYSDGLVELRDRTVHQAELVGELAEAKDARGMVERLVGGVAAGNTDDVTVAVLRRLVEPERPTAAVGPDGARATVAVSYDAPDRGLDLVHDTLARFWKRLQDRPDEVWRMYFELAVFEIEANIVEHARPPVVRLELRLEGGCVVAEFLDTGAEWDGLPDELPADGEVPDVQDVEELPERGRGLGIASAAVDVVTYERTEDGNRWRLSKRL